MARTISTAADVPALRRLMIDEITQISTMDGIDLDHVRILQSLRFADLFWVSPTMTQLALDASQDIPDWTVGAARPSPSGVLLFAGRLPDLQFLANRPDSLARPRALSWGPGNSPEPDCLEVALWCLAEDVQQWGFSPRSDAAMVPCWQADMPLTGSPQAHMMHGYPEALGVTSLIGAVWTLMQEPAVAQIKQKDQPRRDREHSSRHGYSPSPISVVDLRTLRHDTTPARGTGRRLTHRHIVRGHWRHHWMPSTQTHEPRYIAPYIKGPADAPLIAREQVKVWRH